MSFLYGFSPFCHITWETVKTMKKSQFFLFLIKKRNILFGKRYFKPFVC